MYIDRRIKSSRVRKPKCRDTYNFKIKLTSQGEMENAATITAEYFDPCISVFDRTSRQGTSTNIGNMHSSGK